MHERGHTTLQYLADPANPRFSKDVKLPFAQPEDRELAGRTQIDFFPAVLETFDSSVALNLD